MQTVISKDSTKIAYSRQGQGPALVLVDGAMCFRSSGPMEPLAAQLVKQFCVYTYDRRGRGESSDAPSYTVEREIADIDALIKEAGGTAYVYGISSGAVLALRATAELGGRVNKLALYEPPFISGEPAQKDAQAYTKQLTKLLNQGQRGDAVALFLKKVGTPDEMIPAMRYAPMWPGMEALAPTLAYDNAVMGDGTLPVGVAKAVKVSALVMAGSNSPAFMRQAAQELADAVPHAEYQTLEGQTHDVNPEVLAQALANFFRA